MGVVNVTPDSFSDGAGVLDVQACIARAWQLLDDGADLIDIGGESTRPGAAPVEPDEEFARIAPVLAALRDCGRPVSVDTRRASVMRAALEAGVDMINDVAGFRADGAIDAVIRGRAALCVMHMQGEPATMQQAPAYGDVVCELGCFFEERLRALRAAGVDERRVVLDPGIGFGKTLQDNLRLLRALSSFTQTGCPVLVGVSRKSLIGEITGRPVGERLAGSLAAMLAAVAHGARIVRVHDVAATRDAIDVWQAIGG